MKFENATISHFEETSGWEISPDYRDVISKAGVFQFPRSFR